MLHLKNLTYRVGDRILLDNVNIRIPAGHKVGFVGQNGTGKTTLLKLIMRQLSPSGGDIVFPQKWELGMTTQNAPEGCLSLLDTVLTANKELTELKKNAEDTSNPERLAQVHDRLRDLEAYSAEARAARILAGLGFDDDAQHRPCHEFSGGWRMRIALASLLFVKPDLLLLDEPTNHLDLEATLWLEDFLKQYRGTLIVVSHDRHLLNLVVQEILHLETGKLTLYSGGYDKFENARRMRLEQNIQQRKKQENERAHIQNFVDRFRYKASKAKQAQSRLKKLQRLQPIADLQADHNRKFIFPTPSPLSPPLLTLEKVDVGYTTEPVLRDINIRLDSDDRIAILGANGNGKSTLIKLLAGRLKPTNGRKTKSSKLRIGYFAQHQTDELNMKGTPVSEIARNRPRDTETQIRSHLGRFGFDQDRAETQVTALSGGEKARLLFALMSCNNPHILLLDEPTNHLDVDYRQALIQAINRFEGAVIIVSHDPHVIELTVDHFWIVQDGAVKSFNGDVKDYRQLLLSRQSGKIFNKRSDSSHHNRKKQRRTAASMRANLAPLKKALAHAEDMVESLDSEKKRLQMSMADPALYDGDSDRSVIIQKQLGRIEKELEKAEKTWIKLQEDWDQQKNG